MLDSLRKRDNSRPGYTPPQAPAPQSPFGRMQEALSPALPPPAASTTPTTTPAAASPEEAKPDAGKSATAESTGSKLIVGPDIKLKGAEITDCDTLVVEGRVEASMDSRAIQIAEQGVFVGTAGVDMAEIRGRFEGELTVRKQLVIRSTGRISGKIRYGKVSIEEGGELSGDIASLARSDSQNNAPASVSSSAAMHSKLLNTR